MGIMDLIVEELNKDKSENEPKWKRLHSEPYEIIQTKNGCFHNPIKVNNNIEDKQMFTTTRYFYPHGIEGESMDNTVKEFDNIEKAIVYCHRYATGVKFAGVQIEDENGKVIYEISSDYETYDYRK